ncbi:MULTISPECIES: glycine oxidase ThiO [Rhizobium]|uniref:glycine oxidase ThiO n=1 Tax=Rhizobium TaxID=379 RepID=UPI0016208FD7|nr:MULTISPECIES: glycine oxidase ThiO [Rhizobium]MBB6304932.1 glycine oxidase [Rhizobium leucaenae]MDK4743351.1 glycine oxidase ThiO [Rhizobium sp. CNPSo 3464]
MRVLVKGAGIAGLTVARQLCARGAHVTVSDPHLGFGRSASWLAGGMLAPWCERVNADERVMTLGKMAVEWWDAVVPGQVIHKGTLVAAPQRDSGELGRFAARTSGYEWLDEDGIAELDPALAQRFRRGLFFQHEAHLNPRQALRTLKELLSAAGVVFTSDDVSEDDFPDIVDCTGAARIGQSRDLRGVRGEMLYLHTEEVMLASPIRLLHPRFPVYVVPRGEGLFMVGATMIETEFDGAITARSTMELLNAAYTLHPAFADATVVETGAGIRPAFPDNFPRVMRDGRVIHVNGLYRHGFLLAPTMAAEAADLVFSDRTKQRSFQCT